jgi:hypothetical protein
MPHVANNHVQSNLQNALHGETSSQLHRVGQNGPQVEAVINTNGNNGRNVDETDVIGQSGGRNNTNRDNKNGGRGRLPPNDSSNEHGSSEDHYIDNRRRHDHHLRRDPFTTRILGSYIPIALEKPLKLEIYNSTIDPDEHVEHIRAQWAIRCKLIVLTLKGAAMTCFKGLEDNSKHEENYA